MSKRFQFSREMNHDIMDQVVLVNPFGEGATWGDVEVAVKKHHPLITASRKSIMDHAQKLMKDRRKACSLELSSSGLGGGERTAVEVALDEAIELQDMAELDKLKKKMNKSKKEQAKAATDVDIMTAAMGLGAPTDDALAPPLGALAPHVGAPAPPVGAPAPPVGAPAPHVGAPAPHVGAPAPPVGAPAPHVGAPPSGLGKRGSAVDKVTAVIEKKMKIEDDARKEELEFKKMELELRREELAFQREMFARFVPKPKD